MNRRPAPSATISRLPRSRVLGLLLGLLAGATSSFVLSLGASFAFAVALAPVAIFVLGVLMVFNARTRWLAMGLLLGSIPGLVQLVALTLWLLRSYG